MSISISTITKPFNPSQIEVESKSATVNTLLDMLRSDLIDLQPDFQRHPDLWKETQKSRLVESVVLGLPLPSFYFEMDRNSKKWIVIDGLQRLCALRDFMTGKLKLKGLEFLGEEWNDATYETMPYYDKVEFGLRTVNLNILKGSTPANVKFIIFKRLNSAGLALTPSEIRNALFQGKCRELIKELLPVFHSYMGGTFAVERMRDRDYITRFLAHRVFKYVGYDKLDNFLCDAMQGLDTLSDAQIEALKESFVDTIGFCFDLFGADSFRKPSLNRRNTVSIALFECVMVELSKLSKQQKEMLQNKRDAFLDAYSAMFEKPSMKKALSDGTGKTKSVNTRFKEMQNVINSALSL